MAGYVPLFDSLTKGTLNGRWPDIGLWPVVLCMADKHGHIDATPKYIADCTGLDIDEVIACMKRFCEPDRQSRSQTEDGRRLQLVDPRRDWGWRVVNHAAYREKARLLARDTQRTASGADAERKRAERARKGEVSPGFPPSDADADADASRGARPPPSGASAPRSEENFRKNPVDKSEKGNKSARSGPDKKFGEAKIEKKPADEPPDPTVKRRDMNDLRKSLGEIGK